MCDEESKLNESEKLKSILTCTDDNNNVKFKNIALYGNFGYGKTTLVNKIFNKDNELLKDNYYLINIELSNYININKSDKTTDLPSYVSELIIMKIEKIVPKKYTLYADNSFSRVNDSLKNTRYLLIAISVLIILYMSSYYIVKFNIFDLREKIYENSWISLGVLFVALVILLSSIFFLYKIIKQLIYRRNIKKVKVNHSEIEFDNKFKDKTQTNYYVDVISYLTDFHVDKKNIVFSFEDIDRLGEDESNEYLDFLRNLNYSLNSVKSNHSFIFLYSLKEIKDTYGVKNKFFEKSIDLHSSRDSKKILKIIEESYNEADYNIFYKKDITNNDAFSKMLNLELVKSFFNELDREYKVNYLNDYREINNLIEQLYCNLYLVSNVDFEKSEVSMNYIFSIYDIFFATVFKSITINTKNIVIKLESIFNSENYEFKEHYARNLALSLSKEFDIVSVDVLEKLLIYMFVKLPQIYSQIDELYYLVDKLNEAKEIAQKLNGKNSGIDLHASMSYLKTQIGSLLYKEQKAIVSVSPNLSYLDKSLEKISETIEKDFQINEYNELKQRINEKTTEVDKIKVNAFNDFEVVNDSNFKNLENEVTTCLNYIQYQNGVLKLIEFARDAKQDLEIDADNEIIVDFEKKYNTIEENNSFIKEIKEVLERKKVSSTYKIYQKDYFRDIIGIPKKTG